MAKYRHKSVEFEAFQWSDDLHPEAYPDWFDVELEAGRAYTDRPDQETIMCIETRHGTVRASEGDYIIQGVTGDLCTCKPGIFKALYEEVELLAICESCEKKICDEEDYHTDADGVPLCGKCYEDTLRACEG